MKKDEKKKAKRKILLGVTGSVAATLTPKLVEALQEAGYDVRVVATETSRYFWKRKEVDARVYRDRDEWRDKKYRKGSPVLHIVLRDWADALLIAPLSANTLGKIANGLEDNLLTCVARAWPVKKKPIVIAPAMNTAMWVHPATTTHLAQLKRWVRKFVVVSPVSKKLACGDTSIGAMAPIDEVVKEVGKCVR